MKNSNFPILLVLLAGIAVACWWTTPAPATSANQALRLDLERSLKQLWGNEGQEITLTNSASGGLRVSASVTMPEGASAQQRTWSLSLLKFVALRHPEVQVTDWQVKIPQIKLYTPFPLTQEQSEHCELLTRQAELILKPLASPALVLVDTARLIPPYGAPEVALIDHPRPDFLPGRIFCIVAYHPLPEARLRQELVLQSYDSLRILVLPRP